MSAQVKGLREFTRLLDRFPKELVAEADRLVKQEARELCVHLCAATLPAGLGEGAAEPLRKRIAADVGRVFVTQADKQKVFRLLERRSPALAHGFLRASRQGNASQVRRYLRDAGISVEALNPGVHKAARTGKGGTVPKGYQSDVVVGIPQRRVFTRKQQQLAGFAKAGWCAAAKGIGGRARRNLTSETGERSTSEKFPSYVRKLANRFPGLGGAIVSPGRVVIFSNVRHAADAMPDALYRKAIGRARSNLIKALDISVQKLKGAAGRMRRAA